MNLGDLIVKARNIGDRFASWFLIDTNIESIELLGSSKKGYNVEVKLKQEEINEEELDRLANEHCDEMEVYSATARSECKNDFKAGYRKAKEGKE